MTNPAPGAHAEELHLYEREIRADDRTSLTIVASHVLQAATVLDLGCGTGALGKYLQTTKACTVDGLTISQAEAARARAHYRTVEVADLETCDLHGLFGAHRYDYIVCADVLEHLRFPERVLAACRGLLAPGGAILISVPNAGYSGLIAELLIGEFRYRDEGLLDRTHIRFFTRKSLLAFLHQQHWDVEGIETVVRKLPESEFRAPFDALPPSVARYLLAAPDALTYQIIAKARPLAGHAAAASAPPDISPADLHPPHALFTAAVYYGHADAYTETRSVNASGIMGEGRQTLLFQLPAEGGSYDSLRLDPADRPGFMHLHQITLRTNAGETVWEWHAERREDALALAAMPSHQILLNASWNVLGANQLLLHGDDPWIVLPIPASVIAETISRSGGSLSVEVGWPMSADYLALASVVQQLQQHAIAESQRTAAELASLELALRQTRTESEILQQTAQASKAKIAELQEQLDALQSRHAALQQWKQELQQQKSVLQTDQQQLIIANARLREDAERLSTHLQWIENSTVFRVSRPLVRAKMWVDRLLRSSGAPQQQPTQAPAPLPPIPQEPVDIVVPVYKGLEDTRACISSVLASQCQTPFRLIVINDASPEPALTAWLREQVGRDPRYVLLENAENLGFVGTVNRGMSYSDGHDVLLLNSDTEVANDWLDRLRRAAYCDAKVATVTPFSTNATICSYPTFCAANELPAGYDTARLDALFARTNAGQVVDIPTGVGFCMYIRRDSLRAIGLFDVETFKKGYGEENDYCRRAVAKGWRNLHALDTFVLHTGGVSFGDSKNQRERDAVAILRRLYPDYEPEVMRFVERDPARPYRQLADLARLQEQAVPTVLVVAHNRGGGTQRHTEELALHLRGQAQFLLLSPAPDNGLRLQTLPAAENLDLRFQIPEDWELLQRFLRAARVAHIHIHHLIGHDSRIADLPKLLGVSYDFTAHDFYSFCPQITLTEQSGHYCGERGTEQCRACLARSPGPGGVTDITAWRETHARILNEARQVLAPSVDTARRYVRFFPAADIRVAPHTDLALLQPQPAPSPSPLPPGKRLRIAVLGALSIIKGADLLEQVALLAAKQRSPVEFHLLGYAYRSLRTQPRAALTVHGEYTETDLPGLLHWLQPDLVWFPALWPETYSYTLSACLLAGLPVAAPDLGAFAERLASRPWTWIRRWDTPPQAWLEFFETIRTEHFLSGTGPTPPAAVPATGLDARMLSWDYRTDYLKNLTTPTANPPPLGLDILPQGPFGNRLALSETVLKGRLRQRTLRALNTLRHAAMLRPLARSIPHHWQRRVKDWLVS
ncbi:methyltransferase domain-containing protein [Ramlibacter sp. H39-3-26]|uniref:methyltransferase domain-containing protein n=1 Tax=Curvibacter soli TaxID=3031331 RepID=UPI0023DBE006|nr:methyltransferase domain-containing protein [Ramlibacter sp. H39-3-26]MDF1486394.1 methyltransferase domain-containing protein [Ramlibacter sp. H39-3-26]